MHEITEIQKVRNGTSNVTSKIPRTFSNDISKGKSPTRYPTRRGEAESEGVIERFHGYAIPGTTSNRSLGGGEEEEEEEEEKEKEEEGGGGEGGGGIPRKRSEACGRLPNDDGPEIVDQDDEIDGKDRSLVAVYISLGIEMVEEDDL
ncbi:hypothetical protein HZH66_007112 [Vespula vulgaris]|uniref:Uncharacterized protein n=1 Tax=Vespula vulgaris TaxID=7454 RepID=A0A834JY06_VESVU|nr:hypothetical protein HZH66_007112 [Vespula vulgaris]